MNPLNGHFEAGIRSLVVLTAAFPVRLDVAQLVYLDHVMLHSGDLDGGPPSLQPDLPVGPGELGLRRTLVEQGLVVLMRAGLADLTTDEGGFLYGATEEAASFLGALQAHYVVELRARADWLADYYLRDSTDVREDMKQITRRWATQVLPETSGNREDQGQ
ncbi:ABC-three component system middle component 2 [Streptomyces canus]